jgi:hypothetical protein
MAVAKASFDGRDMFKGIVDPPSPLSFRQSIVLSSQLSKLPMVNEAEVIRMVPADVVPELSAAKIDFMLVGAHGISGWLMQPRATQDVDVLVRPKDKSKTAQVVLAKFPDLKVEKCPQFWRLGKDEQVLLDIMLADSPLHKRVCKEFDFTRIGKVPVKIPKVECALAMKFAAMTGHYRKFGKKYLDAGDFISIIEKNKKLNVELLKELGELQFAGGGSDLLKYVDDARAGRRLEI